MLVRQPTLTTSNPVVNQAVNVLSDVGSAFLHYKYPKDFEYYLVALEIKDSQNRTVDFFSFPITPKEMSDSLNKITSINKTMKGISVFKDSSFEPQDINISGNFGRRFRIVNTKVDTAYSAGFSISNGFYGRSQGVKNSKLPGFIKTGYGCVKYLEAMIKRSSLLDNNDKPFRMCFYNLAFGESYLVEPINFTASQNLESNMIWNYNLSLKAIAPLEGLISSRASLRKTLLSILTANTIIKNSNSLLKSVSSKI